MGAIKLPVHCDGNVPGDIMDADYRIVAACEDPDDAPLIVAALTDRPVLLARVEELEGALAEMVAASDPDAPDDDEAGYDRCLRAIKAARAALSKKL